jgi:hypothetical protein
MSHDRRLISCRWSFARGLCFFPSEDKECQKGRAEAVLIAVRHGSAHRAAMGSLLGRPIVRWDRGIHTTPLHLRHVNRSVSGM